MPREHRDDLTGPVGEPVGGVDHDGRVGQRQEVELPGQGDDEAEERYLVEKAVEPRARAGFAVYARDEGLPGRRDAGQLRDDLFLLLGSTYRHGRILRGVSGPPRLRGEIGRR